MILRSESHETSLFAFAAGESSVIRRNIFLNTISPLVRTFQRANRQISRGFSFWFRLQILLSHFDAFKFPSSEVVQFRALVMPCMPTCDPVQCDQEETTGELRSVISYGRRRRRRRSASPASQSRDDLLLVQSIQITDKFGFERDGKSPNATTATRDTVFVESEDISSTMSVCMNLGEAIVAGTIFLVAQIAIIAAWTFTWQRRRQMLKHQEALSVSVSVPGMHSVSGRTDSLCKLYDGGYPARRF